MIQRLQNNSFCGRLKLRWWKTENYWSGKENIRTRHSNRTLQFSWYTKITMLYFDYIIFVVTVKSKIILFVFIQCTASLWGSKTLIDQIIQRSKISADVMMSFIRLSCSQGHPCAIWLDYRLIEHKQISFELFLTLVMINLW